MDLPELILNYRRSLERTHSRITVKNYASDINHFIAWFANSQHAPFRPELLTKVIISEYQVFLDSPSETGNATYSYKSSRRHLSSLRSFTAYLKSEAFLVENPFEIQPAMQKPDHWKLKEFKNFLHENKSSDLTIKYYINDVQSFSKWYEESVGIASATHTPSLNAEIVTEYTRRLQESLLLSPKTINRKLSGLRRYVQYLKTATPSLADFTTLSNLPLKPEESLALAELTVETPTPILSKIPPVRLVQKLTNPYFSLENKAADLISSKVLQSRLRKTFQAGGTVKAQPIDDMMRGLAGRNIKKEFYAPYSVSTADFPVHKKIAFHLRHTRPEWYKKYHTYPFVHYMHFGILVVAAVGAGIFLFQHTIGDVTATDMQTRSTMQRTFVFKGKLLDKNSQPVKEYTDLRLGLYTNPTASGSALAWQEVQSSIKPDENGFITVVIGNKTTLPDALFQGNAPLFLGITVGNEEELSPRQPIGVPYAMSSDNVQGLSPITSSDKQTNVLLALDASGVLSIGGDANPVFQATGGTFTISGNTVLLTTNAGSGGNVVINPTGNGKIDLQKPLTNSEGTLSTEGSLVINATTSATPAFSIHQDSGGPLLVASAGGAARFAIDSQGTVTKGIWAGTPISPEFGGFGANITPVTPGELLYSSSTTAYGHLRPGLAGQCLTSNGYAAPLWSSCGFLSQINGALSLTNNTLDIVLGSTATGSAKFAFTNMNGNSPTFKVGQTLSLFSNTINADNQDLRIGGDTTKNVLLASAGGSVGIGTTTPTRNLDVQGSWGGSVDYYVDGPGDHLLVRTAPALIYDLEKSTGSNESSTTTTYNIVGLPTTEGTVAYLYTKVSKDVTTSNQTQTINIRINNAAVGTVSTTGNTSSSTVIKHYTVVRSNNTWHLLGEAGATDAADLAEWTAFSGEKPMAGSIVSIDNQGKMIRSTVPYDARVAGIVSTNPRITIGLQEKNSIPLALSGRIPTLITSVNGKVEAGEYVSSSPLPGVGMRLTRSGATVGKTLEPFIPSDRSCPTAISLESISWPDDNGKNPSRPCFKIPVSSFDPFTRTQLQQYGLTQVDYLYIGKVMVLSQVSWSNAEDLLSSIDSASIESSSLALETLDANLASAIELLSSTNDVVKVGGKIVNKIEAFSAVIAGRIQAGSIVATNVIAQNFKATAATISNLTVSDKLTAAQLVSPLVVTDSLLVNELAPKDGKNIAINLPTEKSQVVIRNPKQQEVVAIDASGNASFSGTVTSATVTTNDATVSGTLRAGNLIADTIDGLDSRLASYAAQIAASKPTVNEPLPHLSDTLAQASISAKFGTFYEGLLSLGASTFGNISVMDQLSIGTTFIFSEHSINTLGSELAIQSLRQGAVSFLAGAVRIESDGRLIVNEDALFNKNLAVKGKLLTNIISPLSNRDVSVSLPSNTTHESEFNIKNASGSAVLAISQRGDMTASGSATFEKLNFTLVGQAQASDAYTATATSSAGTAILKANTSELTIINPLITEKSLIYITPAQNTNDIVLYLMRQSAGTPDTYNGKGSFTVGISQFASQDILFNWLIVN